MTYKVIAQPRAEADITETYFYIREFAPAAAVRWYQGIKNSIESLSYMPDRCTVAPESEKLQHVMKQLHYGKNTGIWRILFRIVEDRQEVHILAIRHAARKPLNVDDLE